MAVDGDYRRRGIAAALYAALEREARRARHAPALGHGAGAGVLPRQGFEPVSGGPERDALLGGCLDCAQFGRECEPQALTKTTATTGGLRRP